MRLQGAQPRVEGDPVTLTGHGPVAVYFGNRSAVGVVIEGDFLIRATTPKRELAGSVDVQLHFDDGVTLLLKDAYTYEDGAGLILRPDIAR